MEELREVKLPVGYKTPEGLFREVVLQPLTGKTLLRARAKIGDNLDPSIFLDVLSDTVREVKGLSGPFSPGAMFWVDADFIFKELAVWESEAMGEPLKVRRTCPSCQALVEADIPPEALVARPLEDTEFARYPDLLIPVKLTSPLRTLDPEGTPHSLVKIGLLTVEDEVERIRRYARQPGRMWVEGLRLMIYEVGPKKKGQLTQADIETLSARDLKRIERIYLDNEPGLRPIRDITCRRCGQKFAPEPAVTWLFDFLLTPGMLG